MAKAEMAVMGHKPGAGKYAITTYKLKDAVNAPPIVTVHFGPDEDVPRAFQAPTAGGFTATYEFFSGVVLTP